MHQDENATPYLKVGSRKSKKSDKTNKPSVDANAGIEGMSSYFYKQTFIPRSSFDIVVGLTSWDYYKIHSIKRYIEQYIIYSNKIFFFNRNGLYVGSHKILGRDHSRYLLILI